MDFIIYLLELRNRATNITYNTILIIVDRLIKYIHFILYKATIFIRALEFLVINRLIRH